MTFVSDVKDKVIAALQSRVQELEEKLALESGHAGTYYSSPHASTATTELKMVPMRGMAAQHVSEIIHQYHSCDFNPRLNTSSYVNVVSEPEEQVSGLPESHILLGLRCSSLCAVLKCSTALFLVPSARCS